MINMKLHIKLAENRMTQKKLYELTGIPKNTIAGYVNETFQYINREHLNQMCEIFNCSVSDLVEYVEDKK
ncbi:XRE family transcriptional regulator [Clostridium botulinum]|uniref:helix-turn-helix domain-containing protein n=1 Tax=Clostridium botulinum TaxID=1491 RepID=UPI00037CCE11|nr:helix-turn-helix transcriptional regulator [Clostridium botulinum]MBN1035754.1 XRE family transcriptional regulator [Clostridium botulinum]MBN1042323.1 XRE family transcriptional regulator [Clostridium botulinum]